MTTDERFLGIGLYINSALYLAGVFVLGLTLGHHAACKLALAAAGVSYLTYFAQISMAPRWVGFALCVWSVVFGVGAGLALLG
jgi:hypothetical protein